MHKRHLKNNIILNIRDNISLILGPSSNYIEMGPVYKTDLVLGEIIINEVKQTCLSFDLKEFKEIFSKVKSRIDSMDTVVNGNIFNSIIIDNIYRFKIIFVYRQFPTSNWRISFSYLDSYNGKTKHITTISYTDFIYMIEKVKKAEKLFLVPDDFKENKNA